MRKFKTPLKRYKTYRVRVTQGFGMNQSYYSRYKDSAGNPLKGHNGVDLTLGQDPQSAYGADLNFLSKGKVVRVVAESPMSTKGNGVYYMGEIYIGNDGLKRYDYIVLWHMAEVGVKAGQQVEMGDYAGDLGNSGIVFPKPTISNPYLGTHLHLGVYPYILKDGQWQKEFPFNGYGGAIDPLLYIDNLNPPGWEMKNTLENILDKFFPIEWAVPEIKKIIDKIRELLK